MKLKTSPARLAQLLQPSLAFCFSLQPMTAHRPVHRHWLQAKPNANEGCNSCASIAGLVLISFVACFILLAIAPLAMVPVAAAAEALKKWDGGRASLRERVGGMWSVMGPLSSQGTTNFYRLPIVTIGLYLSPFSQCSGCSRQTDRQTDGRNWSSKRH